MSISRFNNSIEISNQSRLNSQSMQRGEKLEVTPKYMDSMTMESSIKGDQS